MDLTMVLLLVVAMAVIIAVLVLVVIMLIWKLRRPKEQMTPLPIQMIQEIHTADKDGNGIPDGIERNFERMEREMNSIENNGSGVITRRSWGSFDANINGRRIHKKWGAPDKESKRLEMSMNLYRSGDMSQDEFMEEMKRFGGTKSR